MTYTPEVYPTVSALDRVRPGLDHDSDEALVAAWHRLSAAERAAFDDFEDFCQAITLTQPSSPLPDLEPWGPEAAEITAAGRCSCREGRICERCDESIHDPANA